MENKVGKLLIAHPRLPAQTPFYKSVIYIYADSENGAMGIVLNKPTRFTFSQLAASRGFEIPVTKDFIRAGGPVNEKSLLLVHTADWSSSNTTHIKDDICITSDDFMLEKLAFGYQPVYWRLISGLCVWQKGQLEMELLGKAPFKPENSWLICDSNEDIMFTYDGERQWEKAVELSSQQMINSYF